jgi:hypothetical protein
MQVSDAFIAHGLEQARYVLFNVRNLTDMVRAPVTLRRGTAQRARAKLKILETIVRRLLWLMALGLTLAPVRPRAATGPVPLAPGVEDVTQSFPSVPACRISLAGRAMDMTLTEGSGHFPDTVRASGPVPAARIFARIIALHELLSAPEAHAKRLARSLERLRRKGEARPVCMPDTGAFRLRAELGLVATALPGMINARLETWESSG